MMARKEKKSAAKQPGKTTNAIPAKIGSLTSIVLVLLYLVVDLIPLMGAIDVIGPQWLYLAVLNLVSTIFIISRWGASSPRFLEKLSGNALSLLWVPLLVLCALSGFFAFNPTESLVVYARLLITVIAFFNVGFLLYEQPRILNSIFQVLSIIACIQCGFVLSSFIAGIDSGSIDQLILSLGKNSGNKNVLAASLVIKAPLIMYCVFSYFSLWRYVLNAVSLFLVVLVIFLLNARAAYLGLFLQVFIYLLFLLKYKQEVGRKQVLRAMALVLIPVLLSLGLSQALLRKSAASSGADLVSSKAQYTTIDKRLATLSDTKEKSANSRLFFWENALHQIRKTPLLGCGYGNWKIVSVQYENEFYDDFNYSKHAHNDFLELAAESGIVAALLFLFIFILALFYTIKILYSDAIVEAKVLSAFSFMAVAGYFVDALLNFPAERPVMQVFFVLALAVIVIFYVDSSAVGKPIVKLTKSAWLSSTLLLAALSAYVCLQAFRSMSVQSLTHFNFATPEPAVTWDEVGSRFPEIPNLAENNLSVSDIKAWYLYKAGRYQDALLMLDEKASANPYSMSREWLKATVFAAMDQPDSAHFYSKQGFFERPRNLSLFNILTRTSIPLGDTATIIKAFKLYHQHRDEPVAWKIYIRSLFALNYRREFLLQLTDSVAVRHPNDPELQHTRYFLKAGDAAVKRDFNTALANLLEISKIYPGDYENMENVALTYYYLKDYANAAKYFTRVVDAKVYMNGKSEFYLSNCLLQLGRRAEACAYLGVAVSRNYPDAKPWMDKVNCND